MTKSKAHIIFGRLLLAVLGTGMLVLLLGAVRSKEEKICSGLDIQTGKPQQKGFVNEKEVAEAIQKSIHSKPVGSAIKLFNLRNTEKVLEENVWIKKAQMFFDNNELLHVQIEQRLPVARILDNAGSSYYIDSTGFKLPLSNNKIANVPVFTGMPVKAKGSLLRSVINMSVYINSDSFWLAQAAQIDVSNNKFELYPSFGNHVVDLGDGSNPRDKLERVKLFYKKVLIRKGFDAYQKLSVAYDRQVIAIKKDSSSPDIDAGKAVQAFDQMVKTNRAKANEEDATDADKKQEMIRAVIKIESANDASDEKPPDIKNKGNPSNKKNEESKTPASQPKAVMQKLNHN